VANPEQWVEIGAVRHRASPVSAVSSRKAYARLA
jgi:hypothetical protein